MRYIDVRHRAPGDSPQTQTPSDSATSSRSPAQPVVHYERDGLPLIALPNNPTPMQRPHSRARDILAYHQYVFRTVPVLFPACYFHFWRDMLCQEAWEVECIYDAIIALGSLHRASLLLARSEDNARSRGAHTKVTALQTYTMAIEGLSRQLKSQPPAPDVLVAVLLLLAYFEVSLPDP